MFWWRIGVIAHVCLGHRLWYLKVSFRIIVYFQILYSSRQLLISGNVFNTALAMTSKLAIVLWIKWTGLRRMDIFQIWFINLLLSTTILFLYETLKWKLLGMSRWRGRRWYCLLWCIRIFLISFFNFDAGLTSEFWLNFLALIDLYFDLFLIILKLIMVTDNEIRVRVAESCIWIIMS